jgi:hypothetical protein
VATCQPIPSRIHVGTVLMLGTRTFESLCLNEVLLDQYTAGFTHKRFCSRFILCVTVVYFKAPNLIFPPEL